MKSLPITPSMHRKKLRERLQRVLKRLPKYWVTIFLHSNPEYKNKPWHVTNVKKGLSLDENIIGLMEELAELLEPKTGRR